LVKPKIKRKRNKAITPTPKDDKWIGKLYKIIDVCALNIGKAKDKAKKK